MNEFICALILVGLIVILLWPYYSIISIHQSIDKLTEEIRKMRKGEKDG